MHRTRGRHEDGTSTALAGRTVVISGSTRGLGFAFARDALHSGAIVIPNGRSEPAWLALTRALSVELARYAIRVDAVSPMDVSDMTAGTGRVEHFTPGWSAATDGSSPSGVTPSRGSRRPAPTAGPDDLVARSVTRSSPSLCGPIC